MLYSLSLLRTFLIIITHHFCLPFVFSHLCWAWTGADCFLHLSILYHMPLHSQQVHFLHYTLTPLFPRSPTVISPTSSNTHPSALFTCPNHLSLLYLNLTERSSTPHISATSMLDLPSCHLTPAMYLSILSWESGWRSGHQSHLPPL